MKKLGSFIAIKQDSGSRTWDTKSLFIAFERIIRHEYGAQGVARLIPEFIKDGRMFVRSDSSVWANELLLHKESVIGKINAEIGQQEIRDIIIKN